MRAVLAILLFVAPIQASCSARRPEGSSVRLPALETTSGVAAGEQSATRRLAPRDVLRVSVFGVPELSGEFRVSAAGDVSVPLVGAVRAAGSVPSELEAAIAERLRGTYMHDPRVSVEVTEEAPQPVFVLGEVNQPGALSMAGAERMTILQALAAARGHKSTAALGRTVVIRSDAAGERTQYAVDLPQVLKGSMPDLLLLPNDIVYVPKSTERAAAMGVIDALLRVVTFRTVF